MYRQPLIHKPRSPKLWEEEWDPTELDFINNDEETIPDTNILSMKRIVVRRMIRDCLNPLERKVVEAFMAGQTHTTIGVSEKYWRYWLGTALETMREKLVDTPHQLKVKYDFNRRNYEQHH